MNSWFVAGCMYAFPNEFSKWQTQQRWRDNEHVAADLGAEVSDLESERLAEHLWSTNTFVLPGSSAELNGQLELALAMLESDEERAIVKLKALGYSIDEIAEVVGKLPTEIKNFLKRLKRRDIGSRMEEGKRDE